MPPKDILPTTPPAHVEHFDEAQQAIILQRLFTEHHWCDIALGMIRTCIDNGDAPLKRLEQLELLLLSATESQEATHALIVELSPAPVPWPFAIAAGKHPLAIE
jgi:hypothetical protein